MLTKEGAAKAGVRAANTGLTQPEAIAAAVKMVCDAAIEPHIPSKKPTADDARGEAAQALTMLNPLPPFLRGDSMPSVEPARQEGARSFLDASSFAGSWADQARKNPAFPETALQRK